MRRAKRLLDLPPYPFTEIARLKKKALEESADLIDFGIGDPDQPTPEHIVEALCQAARDPATHQYDETDWGIPEFVEAAGQWMERRFGVKLARDGQIKVTIGSKEALAHLCWAYVDPGDIVLVPDPRYAVYEVNAGFAGGEVYHMPLLKENDFLPDFSAIPREVAEKAKLMFLNYPNNPTGAPATAKFMQAAVDFALEHDIILAHDAAYSEVYFDGEPSPSVLQAEGALDCAIEFHSLSKTYNMTGWRIGFAAGCGELVSGLAKLKSNVDSNAFMAIERAAAAALSGPQECVEKMRELYAQRRDWLVDGLNSIGWPVPRPRATFYVWAPVPRGYDSAGFAAALLREAGILVTPGTAYGKNGEGFVRFSLTMKADDVKGRIEEAVARIARMELSFD